MLGLGGNQGDDRPAAYLNYLFFDETDGFDYQNQEDDYGWKEVPAAAYYSKTLVQLDSAIKIKAPGYLYIYLSYENESNNYLYFDDLKINYQKSQIVQSNNYYAFGLQTKDSWTRIDTKPNQYLYNAGSELNEATSNYEMMFRSYDPAIGRMSGVDPMVNKYASLTPYNYSFNDPVYWNDPSGADANDAWEKKFGSGGGGKYEDCACGTPQLKSALDMYGNSSQRADAYFDALNGVYNPIWDDMSTGGNGNIRYGPGDGGGLHRSGEWINDIKRRLGNRALNIEIDMNAIPDETLTELYFGNKVLLAFRINLSNSPLGKPNFIASSKPGPFGIPILPPNWTLVAFSTGIDFDLVVGVGSVGTPSNLGWVIFGPDKGKKFYITDVGFGVGLDVSGGVNSTLFFYTGNPYNFRMETLNGPRTEFNLSFSAFIDIGGGVSISDKDENGGRIIAIKVIGGLGIPTTYGGNVNRGRTVVSPRN